MLSQDVLFIPQIDRFDWKRTADRFERLWPKVKTRLACIRELQQSIIEANKIRNDNWEVTLFKDCIRLNVGQVEVMSLYEKSVVFIFADPIDLIKQDGYRLEYRKGPYYKAVPVPSGAYIVPIDNMLFVHSGIRLAHNKYISLASSYKKGTSWKKAFSPGVLKYMEILLDEKIPFPNYYKEHDDNLSLQTVPEEIDSLEKYAEGTKYQIYINAYERDPNARKLCIATYGAKCFICGFSFAEKYGSPFEGYIHVHHLKPLSTIGKKYQIDPVKDLRPICPNCHAIIHLKKPPFSIEEVQKIIRQ